MFFAIPWSLAAVIDPDGRKKFDLYYRNLISGRNEDLPVPASVVKVKVPFPDGGLVYDYSYQARQSVTCSLIYN